MLGISFRILLIALLATSFAYASEAVEASEVIGTESLIENSVEAEIAPWFKPAQSLAEPELLADSITSTLIRTAGTNNYRLQLSQTHTSSLRVEPVNPVNASFDPPNPQIFILTAGQLLSETSVELNPQSKYKSFSADLNDVTPNLGSPLADSVYNSESAFCGYPEDLTDEVLATASETHCGYLSEASFNAVAGDLDFSSLSITDANYPSDIIDSAESMITIRLNNNALTNIKANAFQNFANLKLLTLNDNDIETIGTNAFDNMAALTELRFYSNQLTEIPENIYSNHPKLETLLLFSNNNPTIHKNAFAGPA